MRSISCVVAARPNFVKVAPLISALEGRCRVELVHTGQHYDYQMSGTFFEDLAIPAPDVHLGVGSGSHAEQTAGVLVAYERHLVETRPETVVVVGDVNATLGAALAAAKVGTPVAHVEAGLRSGDWSMPEEINRVLTDRLGQWLFTPSADASENLRNEGIKTEFIHLVGNIMIDALTRSLPRARAHFQELAQTLGLPDKYAVVTLHRPGNVDDPARLEGAIEICRRLSEVVPIVFPIHPRTRRQLDRYGLELRGRVTAIEPLGYLAFLGLMAGSSLVATDSGGIQEETSVLGIPCLTLRENTERPITVSMGTNQLVGTDPDRVAIAAVDAMSRAWAPADIPLWDGEAARRIADVLLETAPSA